MGGGKVAVAMSGGVDSAGAALLLREAGYEVSGVTLRLHRFTGRSGLCGSDGEIAAAQAAARALGLPHAVVDLCPLFRTAVMLDMPPAQADVPDILRRCAVEPDDGGNVSVRFLPALKKAGLPGRGGRGLNRRLGHGGTGRGDLPLSAVLLTNCRLLSPPAVFPAGCRGAFSAALFGRRGRFPGGRRLFLSLSVSAVGSRFSAGRLPVSFCAVLFSRRRSRDLNRRLRRSCLRCFSRRPLLPAVLQPQLGLPSLKTLKDSVFLRLGRLLSLLIHFFQCAAHRLLLYEVNTGFTK